jgi:hypothetical protein
LRGTQSIRGKKTMKVRKENRCIKREQEARDKLVIVGGRHRISKAMREDTTTVAMRRFD